MSDVTQSIEIVRQLWTPARDVEQLDADLAPQTPLDSVVRDFLHRVVQQHGSLTIVLERNGERVLNTGTLRWEAAGLPGYRELTLWIDD